MADLNKRASTRPSSAPTSQQAGGGNDGLRGRARLLLQPGAPKDVADLFAVLPAYRLVRLKELEERLQMDKSQLARGAQMQDPKDRRDWEQQYRKDIAEDTATIAALKGEAMVVAPIVGRQKLKVGSFFSVSAPASVLQVIDDNNFILKYIDTGLNPNDGGRGQPNAIIWMSGISTQGRVDGAAFETSPDRIYQIIGTKSYDTAGGAQNTIFSAAPVDYKPFIASDGEK